MLNRFLAAAQRIDYFLTTKDTKITKKLFFCLAIQKFAEEE